MLAHLVSADINIVLIGVRNLTTFLATVNENLEPLSMSIVEGKEEDTGRSYYALVCHHRLYSFLPVWYQIIASSLVCMSDPSLWVGCINTYAQAMCHKARETNFVNNFP